MVKAVLGRVYPGKKTPQPDNFGFTVDELKQLSDSNKLVGKPIWLEHKEPAIGEINRAWVDDAGFLCVWADLYDAERLGNAELYASIQKQIANKELPDFSIHWVGQRDASGKVIQGSKTFLEASLTREGAYGNTSVFSSAASKDSKTTVIASGTGKVAMEQQEVQQMFNEAGLEHIDASKLAGMGAVQIGALFAAEVQKAKDQAAREVESRLAPQASMSDAERTRLEQLEKAETRRQELYEEQKKKYGERESKLVPQVFEGIKHMIPEEEHKKMQEHLTEVASELSGEPYWSVMKMYSKLASDRKEDLDKSAAAQHKLTKNNNALMKEIHEMKINLAAAEKAAPQTVEQTASKRSSAKVGFTPEAVPKRQKAEKPAQAEGKEKVEEAASAMSLLEQHWFPKALAVPKGYNMEDESARSFLAFVQEKHQSMGPLGAGLPMVTQNDFLGRDKKYATSSHFF